MILEKRKNSNLRPNNFKHSLRTLLKTFGFSEAEIYCGQPKNRFSSTWEGSWDLLLNDVNKKWKQEIKKIHPDLVGGDNRQSLILNELHQRIIFLIEQKQNPQIVFKVKIKEEEKEDNREYYRNCLFCKKRFRNNIRLNKKYCNSICCSEFYNMSRRISK